MTSFCLLHGAWHDPTCWDAVATGLRADGHEVITPDMPLHDPATTVVDRVGAAAAATAGVTGPLVVVGHSLGARYAPAVAAAHPAAVAVVLLCPALVPLRQGFPFPPPQADGTFVWDPEVATRVMYGRLAPETARALAAHLRPMSSPIDGQPPQRAPACPTALVYATEDEFFAPDALARVARESLGVEGVEIPGGHSPMAEDPAALVTLLERLAGELLPAA